MLEETAWLVLVPWAFLVFALWYCERNDVAKLSKRTQKRKGKKVSFDSKEDLLRKVLTALR
jgi:hypothetical protein